MIMSRSDRLATYASDGRRGYKIADTLFASIIVALRRDPRFRAVPIFDLELLLADTRADAEKHLVRELRDRIHIEDVAEDASL
jgi:hypothetical protein